MMRLVIIPFFLILGWKFLSFQLPTFFLSVIYFVICAVSIFAYGSYRCKHPEFKDILEKKLGIGELDGWSLSHFVFFLWHIIV